MNSSMAEITSCEVCGNASLQSVLDLGLHPMCDDLVEVGSDRVCREYPIEILFCPTCYTAHQRFQIDKHELFPTKYHYRSRHTADVLIGLKDLVATCEAVIGDLSGRAILDIGCNDGSLLTYFAERGAKTFGIEPTGAAEDARSAGHAIIEDYFSEATAKRFVAQFGQVDVVTFTNVFAHIEDLADVIAGLQAICRPNCLIVIENHYLGAILDLNQFDTFYHEHPRTYSLRSFGFIARSLDLRIVRSDFPKRYGGNIRVFLGGPNTSEAVIETAAEDNFGERLNHLSRKIGVWQDRKSRQIANLVRQHGPLAGKAFPGRAAIPVKLLGLDIDEVAMVHEKPMSTKVGHYIPATRIRVVSDDLFDIESSRPLLNLAWHIATEIRSYMRQRGFEGEIVDIISADDFM
jgi:SAM-dependent methyltransferase